MADIKGRCDGAIIGNIDIEKKWNVQCREKGCFLEILTDWVHHTRTCLMILVEPRQIERIPKEH